MAKDTTPEQWFKPRSAGAQWGIPTNRKGWLAIGGFIAVWMLALLWLVSIASQNEPTNQQTALFSAVVILDIVAFLYVSFMHGERPKFNSKTRRVSKKSA